jgi:uncharacterized membrane protein YdjX (TVP38/TMEM64 family)
LQITSFADPNLWYLTISILLGTMLGVSICYWLFRIPIFKKLIMNVAKLDQKEFQKWSKALNSKKGWAVYTATVLFPIFPDDLLVCVVSGLRMNFGKVLLSNFLGRGIGLVTTLALIVVAGMSLGENDWLASLIEICLLIVVYGLLLHFNKDRVKK